MDQLGYGKLFRIKILRIRPETDRSAGILLTDFANDVEFSNLLAAFEAQVIFLAATPDPHFKILRQRVDHRYTDTVQSTCILIIFAGKFSASVQPRQDQLYTRNFFFRVLVDRHPAPVVGHFE